MFCLRAQPPVMTAVVQAFYLQYTEHTFKTCRLLAIYCRLQVHLKCKCLVSISFRNWARFPARSSPRRALKSESERQKVTFPLKRVQMSHLSVWRCYFIHIRGIYPSAFPLNSPGQMDMHMLVKLIFIMAAYQHNIARARGKFGSTLYGKIHIYMLSKPEECYCILHILC